MIVFFDHEDSFSGNLVHALRALSCSVSVKTLLRNEQLSVEECDEWAAGSSGVVLSPGPGDPREYATYHWVESLMARKKRGTLSPSLQNLPVLGVCLGHQILLTAGGAPIQSCKKSQIHGRTSQWSLDASVLLPPAFRGLRASSQVVYYNSLEIPYDGARLSKGLEKWILLPEGTTHPRAENGLNAAERQRGTDDRGGVVFAAHSDEPWFGVQFHPESYASPCGGALLGVFASLCASREGSVGLMTSGGANWGDWRASGQ